MSPFQPLVYIRDLKEINFVRREKFSFDEFYGLISRSFAALSVEISWVVFGSVVIASKVVYCVI